MMFNSYLENFKSLTLPFSNNRYSLDLEHLTVTDYGVEIPQIKNAEGEVVVFLDWFEGLKFYCLAIVVAFTYKPTNVPLKYWSLLKVLYADGNKDNIHPSNLVWKFPRALGQSDYNGYAFIPMYSRYMINEEGFLFDLKRNKFVKGVFKKGYYAFVIMSDSGKRCNLFRHRAIGLVYLDYPYNVDSMQINHINGVKGDDEISNLEWCTASENVRHSIYTGLAKKTKSVKARHVFTGSEREFESLDRTCKVLGLNEKIVSRALGQKNGEYNTGSYILSYKIEEHQFLGATGHCPVLVRNMLTGEVTEYDSIVSCSRALKKGVNVVSSRIENPITIIYSDFLQMKRKSDDTPWYVPDDPQQEFLEKTWLKIVLIKDIYSGEVREFDTQRRFAMYAGIAEATSHQWVNTPGQPVFQCPSNGQYVLVKRKSDSSPWRYIDNPDLERTKYLEKNYVLTRDVNTGKITEFSSGKHCSETLGILATTLSERLKSRGQKTYKPGLQFKLKNDEIQFKIS